jgi:hypothetical protein
MSAHFCHRGRDLRLKESVETIPPSADQVCGRLHDEQPMLRMHDSGDLARVRRAGAALLLLRRELSFFGVVHHRANTFVAAVIHFARAANGDGSD